MAAVASGECEAGSVAACDRALELLRVLTRSGPVEERELAWLSIDAVLERRLELTGPAKEAVS